MRREIEKRMNELLRRNHCRTVQIHNVEDECNILKYWKKDENERNVCIKEKKIENVENMKTLTYIPI